MLAQLETVLRSDVDENEIIQFFFKNWHYTSLQPSPETMVTCAFLSLRGAEKLFFWSVCHSREPLFHE